MTYLNCTCGKKKIYVYNYVNIIHSEAIFVLSVLAVAIHGLSVCVCI